MNDGSGSLSVELDLLDFRDLLPEDTFADALLFLVSTGGSGSVSVELDLLFRVFFVAIPDLRVFALSKDPDFFRLDFLCFVFFFGSGFGAFPFTKLRYFPLVRTLLGRVLRLPVDSAGSSPGLYFRRGIATS